MKRLSIAHVLSSFGMGGQERVALDLATAQHARGHQVLAISLSDAPDVSLADSFRAAGIRTECVAKHGGSVDPTLAVRVSKHLRSGGVELVHTHNPQALVYGSPAAALAGAACVHSKHGVNPDPSRRMWLRRAASKIVDAYVAVTPSLARIATAAHECDPTQLHVIPNGIDTQRFSLDLEARRRIRAELGIPENAWVVGTVGRLAPEKNQALLIDAISPMLDPRRHLVVVGEGPERDELERRAQATWRPELVHFTGARSDVSALLSAFDVFALTSRSEGLPLVLLEAMAMGLPVLSTAVGGIPDLIEHGVTGFLVDPADEGGLMTQLIWLSSRPQSALDVANSGRRLVLERHSTEHMARDYEDLYFRVLRGVRGRGAPLSLAASS
jgi:glycosyltransferase involved in cell wall biosynthesis